MGDAVDSRARELRGYGDPEPLQGKSARCAPTSLLHLHKGSWDSGAILEGVAVSGFQSPLLQKSLKPYERPVQSKETDQANSSTGRLEVC